MIFVRPLTSLQRRRRWSNALWQQTIRLEWRNMCGLANLPHRLKNEGCYDCVQESASFDDSIADVSWQNIGVKCRCSSAIRLALVWCGGGIEGPMDDKLTRARCVGRTVINHRASSLNTFARHCPTRVISCIHTVNQKLHNGGFQKPATISNLR